MFTRRLHTIVLLLLVVGKVSGAAWDSSNYPNPTTQAGAKQCGLRSAGHLCDPDNLLSESERYRINHELSRLEAKTYQEFGRNFCEKKGLVGVILLAKNVKGGTEADVRRMATDLRQRWNLDGQCMKAFVALVSIDDRKFWVSRDAKVPVYAGDFNDILGAQTALFRDKNYQQALLNIVQQTADKTLAKQGQPEMPADDGGRQPGRPGPAPGPGAGGGAAPAFKLPNIPLWVVLVVLLVVVPTLICCCVCYCCCCRNKGGARRQGPSDEDPESVRQGGGGAGGMGDRMRSMLGGAGGGALMSLFQNCLRNRGGGAGPAQPTTIGGGAGGGGDFNRGGYVPPRPQATEGKGLYPSKTVEDEGAGGSW